MADVTTTKDPAEPTLDDLCGWLESKGQRGEIKPDQARQRITAVRQLATPLAADEPRSLEWFLANIEELGDRFARLNPDKKSDTALTYTSRARSSAEDYLRWRDDPKGFRFKSREPSGARDTRKKAAEEVTVPPRAELRARTFPTSDGSDFVFTLPSSGIAVNDVRRIAYHLLTLARDFDPGAPAELFSIQRPS